MIYITIIVWNELTGTNDLLQLLSGRNDLYYTGTNDLYYNYWLEGMIYITVTVWNE